MFSNLLSVKSNFLNVISECYALCSRFSELSLRRDSDPRSADYKSAALPTMLRRQEREPVMSAQVWVAAYILSITYSRVKFKLAGTLIPVILTSLLFSSASSSLMSIQSSGCISYIPSLPIFICSY